MSGSGGAAHAANRLSPLWPDISSDELRVRIGANIRVFRMKAGLTQHDLADRAQVNRSHVSDIENGKSGGIDTIHAIAKALNADWRKLLREPPHTRNKK